jgi:hypothetical protein
MCTPEEEAERLQEVLLGLVEEACQAEPESVKRQRATTKLLRVIMQSNKLWTENVDYYEDALHKTLLYVCENLCEGRRYDPEHQNAQGNNAQSNVMTWVNFFLRKNLANERRKMFRDIIRRKPPKIDPETGEYTDPIDDIISCFDDDLFVANALEKIKLWVEDDRDHNLRNIHIRDQPDVNCQILILNRVFFKRAWRILSGEFELSISTLSSFYQTRCIPPLREFGEQEGFW